MKEKKGAIVLGIGALFGGLLLLLRLKKPALPEPPAEGVVVGLINPPSGANKWQIRIIDDVGLKMLFWGGDARDNIGDAAVFQLSPEWLFPLSVDITVSYQWQEDGEWHSRQLYRAQSIWPYLWDFDIMDWGDEEDPDYRYIFIPDYGGYYYNVAKERFEKA